MLDLSDQDFHRLTSFIKTKFGIDLTRKRQLITSRMSTTILSQGYRDFSSYVDHILTAATQEDIETLLNKLTTNYTYFMREQTHYDFFRNTILPEMIHRHARDHVLSIWSAGCSSGEEPYNISMILMDYLGSSAAHWDTRVLATDISQRVLSTAQKGTYDLPADFPSSWKQKYFVKENNSSLYTVAPAIRKNVIFRTFNLMDPIQFRLKFDVIFCRNVMIYFDQPTKDALVQRFYNATAPGGYLLIGHSETVNKETSPYQYLQPATYRKA